MRFFPIGIADNTSLLISAVSLLEWNESIRAVEVPTFRAISVVFTFGDERIPIRYTKTKQLHVVGLPPTALALLKRRSKQSEEQEKNVFPGLTLTCDEHKALSVVHGGAYEWKDLRRTVGTRLAGLGFDETVIGRVLNHAKHTVTGKHCNQHRYVDEIRAALTAWDVELQCILKNEARANDTTVSGVVRSMIRKELRVARDGSKHNPK